MVTSVALARSASSASKCTVTTDGALHDIPTRNVASAAIHRSARDAASTTSFQHSTIDRLCEDDELQGWGIRRWRNASVCAMAAASSTKRRPDPSNVSYA